MKIEVSYTVGFFWLTKNPNKVYAYLFSLEMIQTSQYLFYWPVVEWKKERFTQRILTLKGLYGLGHCPKILIGMNFEDLYILMAWFWWKIFTLYSKTITIDFPLWNVILLKLGDFAKKKKEIISSNIQESALSAWKRKISVFFSRLTGTL